MNKRFLPIILLLAGQACLVGRITPTPAAGPTPAATETAAAPTPTPAATAAIEVTPGAPDLTADCRSAVDGIRSLLDPLGYPDHFNQGDFSHQPGDFDANTFFSVLPHLCMKDGYVLDYVVHQDGMGGEPAVYARLESALPFESVDALMQANARATSKPSSSGLAYSAMYLPWVEVDGSPAGYLEYNLLYTYGSQFYLFWHSGYNDTRVMCEPGDLAKVQQEVSEAFGDLSLPADVVAKAKSIDYTPRVKIEGSQVIVRFVTFTKWGGFSEVTYTMDKDNPSHLLNFESRVLVEYNCGIMF